MIVALEVELGILRYTEPPEGKASAGSTSRIISKRQRSDHTGERGGERVYRLVDNGGMCMGYLSTTTRRWTSFPFPLQDLLVRVVYS